jgi:glutamate-1-semialdehyde aminotransferase
MSANKLYQEKAHLVIPAGAHTYSRADDSYPENAPPVLERGKDAYVWDMEGRRFLDFGMALRAVTVGYDYGRISNAAALPAPATATIRQTTIPAIANLIIPSSLRDPIARHPPPWV